MSEPQSPVITPSPGWEDAGRGCLTAPPVTTKPTMWSIINRLAKWGARDCGFAGLSCLRLGGALGRGRGDWPRPEIVFLHRAGLRPE